ncbi:MAG TPA: hypothetical protein VNO26_09985 [Candidatus Limnocylindria bacterium]|nr:hypothetical protein [Candidatus Limnocylindria bacterium]
MTWRTLLACGLLLLPAAARAGSISITTTQSAHLEGTKLVVDVTIGNTGDEAAHSVTPLVRFGASEARGKRVEALHPNTNVQDTIELDVGSLSQGTWTYLVAVDYTDANQYPFQAVQAGRLAVGNPPPAKVAIASMTAGKLAKTAELALTVKNLEGVARSVSVRLMPPEGIETAPVTGELTFEPWEEKTFDVTLTNRTALAGSRYPVFATVEYDADGTHFAVLGRGTVEIVPSETLIDRFGGSLWMGAVGLGVLFAVLVGLRARRR